MATYNYLPGVSVVTVDGGLAALRVPQCKAVVVIGTSGQGPADSAFQVVDRAPAASAFGTEGNLIQAMEEVALYGDNIYLFRMGTQAGALNGVGAVSGGATGMNITLGQRTADANSRYTIWYAAGVVYLWLDGNLVFANDASAGVVVDTGDCAVAGMSATGLPLGASDSTAKSFAGSITLAQAAALAKAGQNTPPVFVPAVTGLGLSARDTYLALDRAFDLLSNFPIEMVYVPAAVLDTPNVAYYISTDPTTAANNPAGNTAVLDWLKTTTDIYGDKTYRWASELKDSNGATVTAATFANAADRLSQGFHEVNFGFAIARFCSAQSANPSATIGGCMGFIGTNGPASGKFDLPSTRAWIGVLPQYDSVTGNPTVPGRGMLGIPYLTGTTAGKLNSLCHDALAGFRVDGFFQSDSNEYDGGHVADRNGNPVDIGAYLHVVGDQAYMSNGVGTYVANIAGLVAGLCSSLDEKQALTNIALNGVTQLYRAGLGQLDALAEAKLNVLRFKAPGQAPVLLRDQTAARAASDYTEVLRLRIKFLVVEQVLVEADRFIGKATTDGLQLTAMQTQLDKALLNLQKRGYISKYSYTISTTDADSRLGRAFIDVSFCPANELVQLRATVGITR